jgi:hypothetical protein
VAPGAQDGGCRAAAGSAGSHGHRLSLRDMNLTHKALGVLQPVGDADLLIRY